MTDLSWFDVAVAAIVLLSILFGVIKGLVRELFALGFLVLGTTLAFLGYERLAAWGGTLVRSPALVRFLAFSAILTGVLAVGSLITYLLRRILVPDPLKTADRLLGGFFGLVRGIALATVLTFLLLAFSVQDRWQARSRFAPTLMESVDLLLKLVPDSTQKRMVPANDSERKEDRRNRRTI